MYPVTNGRKTRSQFSHAGALVMQLQHRVRQPVDEEHDQGNDPDRGEPVADGERQGRPAEAEQAFPDQHVRRPEQDHGDERQMEKPAARCRSGRSA